MTKDEIIRALEQCASMDNCKGCPLYNYTAGCISELKKNALDVIKWQREEIRKLKECKGVDSDPFNPLEIERFKI